MCNILDYLHAAKDTVGVFLCVKCDDEIMTWCLLVIIIS